MLPLPFLQPPYLQAHEVLQGKVQLRKESYNRLSALSVSGRILKTIENFTFGYRMLLYVFFALVAFEVISHHHDKLCVYLTQFIENCKLPLPLHNGKYDIIFLIIRCLAYNVWTVNSDLMSLQIMLDDKILFFSTSAVLLATTVTSLPAFIK